MKGTLATNETERDKEWQRALKYHDLDIQLDPHWGIAYNTRGVAHASRGDFVNAVKDYTEAIRLDPKSKFAYENRGYAYTKQKNYNAALSDLSKAIDELKSANPLTYARRGDVYRKLDKSWHALEDYNNALEKDPKNAYAHYNRGLLHVSRKDYDKAIDDFSATLVSAKKPDHLTYFGRAFAYNEKGVLKKKAEYHDKAIEDLKEALKLNEKYEPAYYVMGTAYWNKSLLDMNDPKLLDSAIDNFTLAIRHNPRYVNAYYGRSEAYQAKGQKALAEADLLMAEKLEKK